MLLASPLLSVSTIIVATRRALLRRFDATLGRVAGGACRLGDPVLLNTMRVGAFSPRSASRNLHLTLPSASTSSAALNSSAWLAKIDLVFCSAVAAFSALSARPTCWIGWPCRW